MTGVTHGGRLDAAIARFGGNVDRWLDLSTGINPVAYPIKDIDPVVWQRLPDAAAWSATAAAARAAYGVQDEAGLSLSPGSQMHIQILPWLFKPQAVAVVGFTYQEHGVAWKRAGHEVYVTDGIESAEATARIIVVVNPNNPDGRVVDRQALIDLSRRLAAKGGVLLVDEAFVDVAPRSSIADQTGREGLVVLRSFGKFYGLAGVRLGIALASPILAQRLEDYLGPWAVSGPALAVAAKALSDTKWRDKTQKRLAESREQLEAMLVSNGLEVVGGTALFVLASHGRAAALQEHLCRSHILVRSFPGKPDWLRFGMPANKTALNRLNKAIGSFYNAI